LELIDRLAALVPPPRIHRHRSFGVLAPHSPLSCTHCGDATRIIAFVTDPTTMRDLLTHFGGPTAPPSRHGPRMSALKPSV
jgi:hypothetical protein